MPSGSHARFHGAQRSAFTTRAQKSLTAAGSQHRALDGVVFKNYYIDKAGRKSMKPFSGLGLMQTKAFLALGCGTLGLYQYAGHKSDAPYDGRDENFYRRLRHDYLTSLKATVEGILSPGTPLPWEQPRIVEIPKIKLPLEICVADVVESRDGLEPDSGGKTRTLTIADLDQRTAAAAGATILSNYLAPRFSCTVVGYRPGFSIPKILSALRQATPAPQPGFLLCADIKGYFDYIPRQRCLEALAEMTAVTPDSELIQYTCALLGWDHEDIQGVGLPQGNPLSPVLSNVFAHLHIDPCLSALGPALRYADDIAVVLPCFAAAEDAKAAIIKQLGGSGLKIAENKTEIFDLSALGAGDAESPLYLGARLTWQNGLRFALSDKALWSLHQGLVENRQARRSDLLRDYEPIVKLLERNAQGVEGWLQAYAGMDWTPEQERGFIAILVVHSLLPVGIIDLKIEDWKQRISLAKLQAQAVDWSPMGRKPIWDTFAGQRDALETARVASAKAPLLQRVEAMITAALPGLGDLRKDYITRFKKVMHHKYALHYGRHQSTNPGGRVIANYGDIIHDGVSMLPPLQGWLDTKMGRDKSPGADRWGRLNAVIIDDGLDDADALDAAAGDPGEGEEICYYDDNDGDATDPGDVQVPPSD